MPNLTGIRGDKLAAVTLGLVEAHLEQLRGEVGDDPDQTTSGLLELAQVVLAALRKLALSPAQDADAMAHAFRFLGTLVAVNACIEEKARAVAAFKEG